MEEVMEEQAGELMEIKDESRSWIRRAENLKIVDRLSFERAADHVKSITALIKKIERHHDGPRIAAMRAHRAVLDAQKNLTEPLKKAQGAIKSEIGRWTIEQEKIRRERERVAMELARKREEEERLRMAVVAEEEGASRETVEEILETKEPPLVPTIPETNPKVSGVSTRKVWKWRLVDEEKIPREYMMLNERLIQAAISKWGDKANIPGVEVYQDVSVSVRA
jgi:hypothetical protein